MDLARKGNVPSARPRVRREVAACTNMAFGGVKTPPNAIYSQRSPARTRGTLMPTKRTGGNVMLYGRFSWNLGRPETKGFWPPTRQGYALFWQGFAQSDTTPQKRSFSCRSRLATPAISTWTKTDTLAIPPAGNRRRGKS